MQEERERNRGIGGLILMLILAALVVILSNPIYQWLSGGGPGETYTSVQSGYGGDVTVILTVKDQMVRELRAEGPMETPGVGEKAITTYNETVFEEAKGKAVGELPVKLDGVSGATLTSRAVRKGLEDVVLQAGGDH